MRAAIAITLLMLSCIVSSHSGRTNSAGCHAGTMPYHCHNKKSSTLPIIEIPVNADNELQSEAELNRQFCESVGGLTEIRHYYNYPGGRGYVSVDCETSDTVWEGGLDKRSSLDSVQQALFAAHVTGKQPAVVIYDTDRKEGRFEYRIKTACDRAGVNFTSYPY